MNIQESGENYLETILILQKRNGSVRSIDIANALSYSKASISRAMGILKNSQLIVIDGNGMIHLTEIGQKRANDIYERHSLICQFLVVSLGLDSETAEEDACRIEHVISPKTFAHIKEYIGNIKDEKTSH